MNQDFRPPVPWEKVRPGDEVRSTKDASWWLVTSVEGGVYTLRNVKTPAWTHRAEPSPEELVERRMGKALAAWHAREFYSDPKPAPTTENYPEELLVPGPWLPDGCGT